MLLFDGQLDTAMLNLYEQKFEKSRFSRVDADIIDNLIVKEDKQRVELSELHSKIKDKDFQGIAPEGWHIPSNQEWEQLLANIDPKSDGSEFRSACSWQKPGKDTFGFFALPAGYRFNNGTFHHFGRRARFWSKDE